MTRLFVYGTLAPGRRRVAASSNGGPPVPSRGRRGAGPAIRHRSRWYPAATSRPHGAPVWSHGVVVDARSDGAPRG